MYHFLSLNSPKIIYQVQQFQLAVISVNRTIKTLNLYARKPKR